MEAIRRLREGSIVDPMMLLNGAGLRFASQHPKDHMRLGGSAQT